MYPVVFYGFLESSLLSLHETAVLYFLLSLNYYDDIAAQIQLIIFSPELRHCFRFCNIPYLPFSQFQPSNHEIHPSNGSTQYIFIKWFPSVKHNTMIPS